VDFSNHVLVRLKSAEGYPLLEKEHRSLQD